MVANRRLFALDQGFPQPIVAALRTAIIEADLVWIGDIDARLCTMDDWQILLALYHHERPWEGMVTTDQGMLTLPRELAVLLQTKLTLVVAESAGHDPIKATGLVLTHLPQICAQTDLHKAQVWSLKTTARKPVDPWDHMQRLALRAGRRPRELYRANKLTRDALSQSPLNG